MTAETEAAPSFDMEWELTHRHREWSFMYDPRLITCVWRRFNFVRAHIETRIVDFGCGVGAQTLELGRLGYAVIGVDGAPSAISRAREALPEMFKGNVTFGVGDVTNIGIDDSVVDCVTEVACIEVLDLYHARRALSEAVRILRSDGCMFSVAKADGWEHSNPLYQVGRGSRALTEMDAMSLYGEFFRRVDLTRDVHVDAANQVVPEWIVQCEGPVK
jgi:SAM-dependent methyltransferase